MEKKEKYNPDSYLEFKEHREFFATFFELRRVYINSCYEFYSDYNPKSLNKFTGSLIALIDWTRSQLEKRGINTTEIKTQIYNISNSNDYKKIYVEFDKIYERITASHENSELLPKVQTQEEEQEETKFWKEEEHRGLREVKKGFIDIFNIKNA